MKRAVRQLPEVPLCDGERLRAGIDAVQMAYAFGHEFRPASATTPQIESRGPRRKRCPRKDAKVGVEKLTGFRVGHRGLVETAPFVTETGDTPALYLEKLRLEHAVRLLETTGISLDEAARDCGFTGREQMRRAFQRHRGITPQEYQQRFGATGPKIIQN